MPQVEVKKEVVSKVEEATWRTQSFFKGVDRVESKRWPARSDDERSDADVKAVNRSGLEELRDGQASTLDEDPSEP